jgi:hypothetical protein
VSTYAKLTLANGDGTRSVKYVKVERDGDICVGTRVTKHGDTWERETATAVQRETVVWTPADVIKRVDLTFDFDHGTLVAA